MRSLLSVAKSNDDILDRLIMTGILPITKTGILSTLNNLKLDIGYESSPFSTDFGFTEEEIKQLLNCANVSQSMAADVKQWYAVS